MNLGETRLGTYRHFKTGAMYVAYDKVKHSESTEEEISYVRLSDGEKYSRPLSMFQEDVSGREDNTTGQRQRFKLMDTSVTFVMDQSLKDMHFETLQDFMDKSRVRLPIKLNDSIGMAEHYDDGSTELKEFRITGIVQQGVYVAISKYDSVFVPWNLVAFVKINLKG